MPVFEHDGVRFRYRELGAGVAFVFGHGLGADLTQPMALCLPLAGVRLIVFDCRAHGATQPHGPVEKISLGQFADDLRALLDWLGVDRLVVGGISMGAGVALNFARRFPDRVTALVLSRPAWLDRASPPNLSIFGVVAALIRAYGPERGLEEFVSSREYGELVREHPANAESLVAQFREPRAAEAVARLERIPADVPAPDRDDWDRIRMPALVLASRADCIHPFEYGMELAAGLPDAAFREITPKAVDPSAHMEDARAAIQEFLTQRVIGKG
jgi:pimeloyl-ACP methyl ester carboxylesterase